MALWLSAVLTLALLYYGLKVVLWMLQTRRPPGFPPGPPTVFGIGNLHQIVLPQINFFSSTAADADGGPSRIYLRFAKWARQYGDIIGLKVGAVNMVVLSHPRHVHALFDRRGAIYSGRVPNYGAEEYVLYGGRKQIIFMQAGAAHRAWRTAIGRHMSGTASLEALLPTLQATSAELAHELLVQSGQGAAGTDARQFSRIMRRWALGTALTVVAGARLDDCGGDAFAEYLFGIQEMWLQVLSPMSAANFVPFLRYVPERLAPWKRKARLVREAMDAYSAMLLESARRNRSDSAGGGSGKDALYKCFLAHVIDDVESDERRTGGESKVGEYSFDDVDVAWMGSGLVDASIDTTWAATMSFMLYVAAHPDALRKIQAELDGLASEQGSWPQPGIIVERTPYLRACVYEVLRLRPPGPIALPHRLDQDDEYDGYRIPKDTIVIINAFGMQTDPRDFDEPDVFRPERFLQHPFGLRADARGVGQTDADGRRTSYTFGAGRRGCPGERLAISVILLAVAPVCYAFNFKETPGAPLDLNLQTAFHAGLTLGPEPFSVSFLPRDAAKAAWVEAHYAHQRPVLDALSKSSK